MSAYICDREHIVYLVKAAVALGGNDKFRWYHNDNSKTLHWGEAEESAEIANTLWLENIKSVSARYPNESSATLPGPRGEEFVITAQDFRAYPEKPNVAQVFKSCDCYAYQSCEHEAWEQSEAFAFIQALRQSAWHALPGYEAAAWGAPEERPAVK